jgi:putative hemolysin
VRCALQYAASVAGLLITAEAMVAERPKKEAAVAAHGGVGAVITYVSQIIGELVPKQIALRNPEGVRLPDAGAEHASVFASYCSTLYRPP